MSQVAQMSQPTSRQRVTTNISNEPAITIGTLTALVNAGLIMLFAFVTGFTTEQQAAVMAFATAVVAVIGAFMTRKKVTPVSKLVTGHAAGLAGETLQAEA